MSYVLESVDIPIPDAPPAMPWIASAPDKGGSDWLALFPNMASALASGIQCLDSAAFLRKWVFAADEIPQLQ